MTDTPQAYIAAKLDRLAGKLGAMEPIRPIDLQIAIEAGRDALAMLDQAPGHLLAWQRAYIDAHPETGTLDLIEATVASAVTPEDAPLRTPATPSRTMPDKAATSEDAPDIEPDPDDGSGFRCPHCTGPTAYQAMSGGREWFCPACEATGDYPADQTPVRAALLRTEDGRAELRRQMREHLAGLRKAGEQP